ncbi:hypothetical protein AXG93_4139s1070 [Marchantia polymorpha subsp. ruderalis]|uniref:Uncharacterized protein n=1 Tax=Marchantia polymorpha subsp. ruderalis TaxID=1480154 RepID=A0A176VPQ2_MARPO|nr:hypothetical protein AXG93_4139s1070 [Marchantia polymorpha subsp. ruderalis]
MSTEGSLRSSNLYLSAAVGLPSLSRQVEALSFPTPSQVHIPPGPVPSSSLPFALPPPGKESREEVHPRTVLWTEELRLLLRLFPCSSAALLYSVQTLLYTSLPWLGLVRMLWLARGNPSSRSLRSFGIVDRGPQHSSPGPSRPSGPTSSTTTVLYRPDLVIKATASLTQSGGEKGPHRTWTWAQAQGSG